ILLDILSAPQASTAITFSRRDLYPVPFTSIPRSAGVKYTLSDDGLPVLHGVVGALSCRLVCIPIPLWTTSGQAQEPRLGNPS
ncbi:hypothetical protein BDZ97DRAFT_1650615, partial [Flammula alnicola]